MARNILKSIDGYAIFLAEAIAPWSPQQLAAWSAAVVRRSRLPFVRILFLRGGLGRSGEPSSQLGGSLESRRGTHAVGVARGATHPANRRCDAAPGRFRRRGCADRVPVHCSRMHCGRAENRTIRCRRFLRWSWGCWNSCSNSGRNEDVTPSSAWKSPSVRSEVRAQMKLVDEISCVTTFDAEAVDALRARLAKLVGLRRPCQAIGLAGTYQPGAFEQYRRIVEHDLKSNRTDMTMSGANMIVFAMLHVGAWGRRYGRRAKAINGESRASQPADQTGRHALIARNRAVDQVKSGRLDWDSDIRDTIELCLTNTGTGGSDDARAASEPHAYGPSLRRLSLEAKSPRAVQSGPAWDGRGGVGESSAHCVGRRGSTEETGMGRMPSRSWGATLGKELSWKTTNDPTDPWTIEVDGARWSVRVNDFPDELFYGLLVNGEHVGDFHDWPETWRR